MVGAQRGKAQEKDRHHKLDEVLFSGKFRRNIQILLPPVDQKRYHNGGQGKHHGVKQEYEGPHHHISCTGIKIVEDGRRKQLACAQELPNGNHRARQHGGNKHSFPCGKFLNGPAVKRLHARGEPVSYTHLDVYKRQSLGFPGAAIMTMSKGKGSLKRMPLW